MKRRFTKEGSGQVTNIGGYTPPTMPEIITAGGGSIISDEGVPTLLVNGMPIPPTEIDFVGFTLIPDLAAKSVEITYEKIGTGPIIMARRPITPKAADYTVAALEEGHALHVNGSVEVTSLIPTHAVDPIPVGSEFEIVRMGTGASTILASAGVTMNGIDGASGGVAQQYMSVVIRKIGLNEWIAMGALDPAPELNVLPTYYWADVFKNHENTTPYGDEDAGEDWSGWGEVVVNQGGDGFGSEVPLEWFMRNVVANEAPNGAIIDLTSPTGNMFLLGRMQPPPRTSARNINLKLNNNKIQRDEGGENWGQFFLWGEKVADAAMSSEAVIGADSDQGDTVLYLKTPDADTEALLSSAVAGSIIEIRTNTTRKSYHPDESRTTCFVASVDQSAKTITVQDPLEIDVPKDNPIGSWESSDPSTVTLLQGSLLTASAPTASKNIIMASALGLQPGDWLIVGTNEKLGPNECQFMNGSNDSLQTVDELIDYDPSEDFGNNKIYINEEMHQIASISGNTVTLVNSLGKNKLMGWQPYAYKVDPVQNFTLEGGDFVGVGTGGGAAAWDHQYIWSRYMVNSLITGGKFDMDTSKGPTHRRNGQAVRFDTGDNNVAEYLSIGYPSDVSAGAGYGVSMRKGERNSTVRHCNMDGCRHSIEFWSTAGGCVAEFNLLTNDMSSSIDTHGNWNTGIIIRNNTIKRDRSIYGVSTDTGNGDAASATDAIRIGNNKFIFDDDIQVLNNIVVDYDGNAIAIVPGVTNVVVDGLVIDNVWRILNLKQNSRHKALKSDGLVIKNISARNIKDRYLDIRNVSYSTTGNLWTNLLLQNWEIGVGGISADPTVGGSEPEDEISGMYFLNCDGIHLENWNISDFNLTPDSWAIFLDQINDVTFTNFTMTCEEGGGAYKFMSVNSATNVSGDVTIENLQNETPGSGDPFLLYFSDGSGPTSSTDGPFTIYHDLGATPKIIGGPPSSFNVTLTEL